MNSDKYLCSNFQQYNPKNSTKDDAKNSTKNLKIIMTLPKNP